MNGKAQAYRKEAFQNKYKEKHWSPVRGKEETNVITGELLFVRKGHSNPCLSVTWGFYNRSVC